MNSWSIVGWVSTESYASVTNELVNIPLTVDRDVDGVSTEVSMEYQSRILIEGIDWHLTADAFGADEPAVL